MWRKVHVWRGLVAVRRLAGFRLGGVLRDRLGFRSSGPLVSPREVLAAELRALLGDMGQERVELARRGMSFCEWASRVPESRGPLDWSRFPFQVEWYGERMAHDQEVVVQKSTQIGASALMLRWALFHCDVFARVALYTFPTERGLADFSRQRIRPVIRGSRHLLERVPADAVDNVWQRQIGAGWLYMRGTNKGPVDEINADVICFDEYDRSSMVSIEGSERRVTGPDSAGLLRRVGVPSYPAAGISAAFEASDQRCWQVKCQACGEWARLEGYGSFVANVDQERLALVCARCRRELDVLTGEWVPAYPHRDTRGYHAPKMLVAGRRTIRLLVANSKKTRPDQVEAFYQRDLATPFASDENRLSLEQVRSCVDPDARLLGSLRSDDKFVGMGIDVASARALSVVVGEWMDDGRTRRVFVGEVDDRDGRSALEQLADLMTRYGVGMAAIDNMPDGRFAQAFAARFPGRVFRVGYFSPHPGQRTESDPWRVDDAIAYAGLWRTRWIDAVLEGFRTGAVVLPPLDTLPPEYPAQLGALVRRAEELPNGTVRTEYVKTGADDFAHAEVYLAAAFQLLWRAAGLRALAELEATPVPLLDAGDDGYDQYGNPVYRPAFEDDPSLLDPWSAFG